jgi:DNA-binding LytR/AlgR family response regulator
MKSLIVDDEPLARAYLRRLLESQDVEVVGEAESATEAIRRCDELNPDLLFLDIAMPGISGLQAAGALLHREDAPLVVFVTGFSEHAPTAFEKNALDYLLKPVTPERLAITLVRARERLASRSARRQVEEREASGAQPLERLPIREDYAVRFVPVEDLICAVAREKRVIVRTQDAEYRTQYTLAQLEQMLPPESFHRIHDSCIVNLKLIAELAFLGNHSYAVKLANGLQLPVGRSRYRELQRRLGIPADKV